MSRKRPGFMLTGVLFSAVIMSLVLTGVLLILVNTVSISGRINADYAATHLAKARIERARTVMATNGFDALVDLDETDTIIDSDGVSDPEGSFKRSTTISANYNGNARLTRIDVSAVYAYRGQWRNDATVAMTTIFTNAEQ
ncbi:MAG: hypothetical protein ABIH57_00540 [Candidatus Omnitrophota bacterium]